MECAQFVHFRGISCQLVDCKLELEYVVYMIAIGIARFIVWCSMWMCLISSLLLEMCIGSLAHSHGAPDNELR